MKPRKTKKRQARPQVTGGDVLKALLEARKDYIARGGRLSSDAVIFDSGFDRWSWLRRLWRRYVWMPK